jgi:hypothetical protein
MENPLMKKSVVIALFLALLAVGIAFGVARDLYSSERRILSGEVIAVKSLRQDFKSTLMQPPQLEVKLENGEVVDVATASTAGLSPGSKVSVSEMVMPWGQLWYRIGDSGSN